MKAYAIDANEKPRPGTPEATRAGCSCPVMDNHGGAGRGGDGDRYGWYISGGCIVHAPKDMEPKT